MAKAKPTAKPTSSSFTYDPAAKRYLDAKGRHVPWAAVRKVLKGVNEEVFVANLATHAERLVAGEVQPAGWLASTRRQIKLAHTLAYEVAIGGKAQLTPAHKAKLKALLAAQYQYLDAFHQEVIAGTIPLDGHLVARARLYGKAAIQTYEAVRAEQDQLAGYTEERRLVQSQSPCPECQAYAAQGWQPIGTLPNVGQQCSCKANCQCTFERRKVKQAGVPSAPKPQPPPPKPPKAVPTPAPAPKAPKPAPAAPAPKPPKLILPPPIPLAQAKADDPHQPGSPWGPKPPYGKVSYGGVLVDEQGRVLLREPKNHFDNYAWTWPKGKPEPGDHPADAALREVAEETGHKGEILGYLPGAHKGGTGTNYFYVMRSTGHDPALMDQETASTKWVTIDEAEALIKQTTNAAGQKRDLEILAQAKAAIEQMKAGQPLPGLVGPPPATHPTHPAPAPAPAAPPPAAPAAFPHPDNLEFVKALGGASGMNAELVRDKVTGQLFARKQTRTADAHATDRLKEEFAADELYRAAGVRVPEGRLIEHQGSTIKLTRFVEGKTLGELKRTDPAAYRRAVEEVKRGFAADCLLGNWDVIGATQDNIKIDAHGNAWRIDNGGALRYRAQGVAKGAQFGPTVGELSSLKQSTQGAPIFGTLTEADVAAQVRELERQKAAILAAAPPGVRATLERRLDDMVARTRPAPAPPPPVPGQWAPMPSQAIPALKWSKQKIEDWARKDSDAKSDGLSPTARKLARAYSGSFYQELNQYLVGRMTWKDIQHSAKYQGYNDEASLQAALKVFRKELLGMRTAEPFVIYRGAQAKYFGLPAKSNAEIRALAKTWGQGYAIQEDAILSTGIMLDKGWQKELMLEIRMPAGAPGFYLNAGKKGVAQHPSEKEWLLPHGVGRYRFVGVEERNGRAWLVVELDMEHVAEERKKEGLPP